MTNCTAQTKITELLHSTQRPGMDDLIAWLTVQGFFTCPASTKFHGCYKGGLADHSLRVYELLTKNDTMHLDKDTSQGKKPIELKDQNLVIAALLHDVCKVGAYIPTPNGKAPYMWNKSQPAGHAKLSIERITQFIELEPIEEMMIRFHMGIHGTYEFHEPGSWSYKTQAEYHLRSNQTAAEKKAMSAEEKEEDKKRRYGKTLRNAHYHNPICELMYFCDQTATFEEKARESAGL